MNRTRFCVLCAMCALSLAVSLLVFCSGCGWTGRAIDVVAKEIDPAELLRKYSWFKDAAAALDAKVADIKVYENRFKDLEQAYAGKQRREWAREDREQWSIWKAEVSGVKASYNELAAQYNAQMSKENWRFCEQGRLPQGATVPLPRDYKPYQEN